SRGGGAAVADVQVCEWAPASEGRRVAARMGSRCDSDALVGSRPSTSGWLTYIFRPKTGAS
ncbi:hypothetical protein, partial [Frankia sp. Cr2]|uniref:hypothetical protein n=1 Tax=Frankia sp. Cr2 TaxID=3073932 RepID=UPI002AD48B2A